MAHLDDWKRVGALPGGKAVYYNVKTKDKAKEEDHQYLVKISGEELETAELFIPIGFVCKVFGHIQGSLHPHLWIVWPRESGV